LNWGLRDYQLPPQVWDGNPSCAHEWEPHIQPAANGLVNNVMQGDTLNETSATRKPKLSQFCAKCGAWRGSLGLEPTVGLYVAHIVEVFREVRRVLRKDGTLWLDMGDCYATGAGLVGSHPGGGEQGRRWKGVAMPQVPDRENPKANLPVGPMIQPNRMPQAGLKPKDLVLMPARVALALQADGWWVRSDIIWSKPNPMPESVTDRPTQAHEHILLLAKLDRYYYDADAIREPSITGDLRRPYGSEGMWQMDGRPPEQRHGGEMRSWPKGWMVGEGTHGTIHPDGRTTQAEADEYHRSARDKTSVPGEPNAFHPLGRNKRSVWEIATEPFPEAHFATFPEKLVEPMIAAGTSERGVCPECGAPWRREVITSDPSSYQPKNWAGYAEKHKNPNAVSFGKSERSRHPSHIFAATIGKLRETVGWKPTCRCGREDTIPATVLDPFSGAGTTLLVVRRMGRNGVGIELSEPYCELTKRRIGPHAQTRLFR